LEEDYWEEDYLMVEGGKTFEVGVGGD